MQVAKEAAKVASKEILKIYDRDFKVEYKADESPLTEADTASNAKIEALLEKTNLPILSEEGKHLPYTDRKDWDYYWCVDPIDGTKEFVKRTGQFTVNIGLMQKNKAVAGVVMIPTTGEIFFSDGEDSYKEVDGAKTALPSKAEVNRDGVKRILGSVSHMSDETIQFINQYPGHELIQVGSSLKFMRIAEGKADLYPRLGPTMEWDTAASQGILRNLGYSIHLYEDGKETDRELTYNKENLLNPWFIVR